VSTQTFYGIKVLSSWPAHSVAGDFHWVQFEDLVDADGYHPAVLVGTDSLVLVDNKIKVGSRVRRINGFIEFKVLSIVDAGGENWAVLSDGSDIPGLHLLTSLVKVA